jgi:2-polyprenyl-3-methyl-5-hydroxy-6-metoxy-1,4-benzoquinol methylase
MKKLTKYILKFTEKIILKLSNISPRGVTEQIDPLVHNTQKNMDEFYSDSEKLKILSNDEQYNFYGEVVGLLQKINHNYSDLEVADFGCGIGGLLETFHKFYPSNKLYGFDFSKEAIKVARTNVPSAEFDVCDFIDGKLSRKFDIIFCTEVLEHTLYPKIFIKNISGYLKNNGFMIITVPDGRQDTYQGHINFWSPESWLIFMEENFPSKKIEVGPLEKGQTMFCLIKSDE